MVEVLIKGVADISDDLLILYHSRMISGIESQKFRNVFLNYTILAIEKIFLDYCTCLRSDAFLYMYSNFKPDIDHSFNDFKIVNRHYLEKIKIFRN